MAELGVDMAYNAEQTTSTISNKGARTIWIHSTGKDKDRLTFMLLRDSLGRKYLLYLVVKAKPSTVTATLV
ncbi:hypothetical protein JG688_00015255 [Phytophthora aleatoria]|uniref:Uncharacterized protein n=1 Tax=Phytophthora aleatoria TaxID=2496075 RepID=A0A8J5IZP4_9STRA|nr:hypothetical protein JG688_00015255 [Phytophthora aleatoria]